MNTFVLLIFMCLQLLVSCNLSDENWWKSATFYQIYPKSFKDADGDGIGDLNGIIEKLDYIKNLGVTGVWLNPIMLSPQKDAGYDISDFRQIDPIFGNLKIFKSLLVNAHKIGLKIIVDFVPNHTSDQHEWFIKSEEGDKKYSDYYIWKDTNGSTNSTPNNWYISPYQCPFHSDRHWWKTATFYQIYPKSFKDTEGDGIGDLNGVIEKLDYIESLGVAGILLDPIFKSPLKDQGYDISDYRQIHPMFGNLKVLKKLLSEAHKRGLRVILEYVPNHTSNRHEWFKKSIEGEMPYKDYYIWKSGKTYIEKNLTEPPNNWISNFKYSAWEYNAKRKKFYLHQFLKEQPDLNYRNLAVRNEMKDVLTYWLDKLNVDGVRIDAVPFLVEDMSFRDEPFAHSPGASNIDYEYLNHIYTLNQPESYQLVYQWRKHIDKISKKTRQTKICMAEAVQSIQHIIPYYGTRSGSQLGAHFAFNFNLLRELKRTSTATDLAKAITDWLDQIPNIYISNWVLGNHDVHRIASRLGTNRVDSLNMLTGFLPGIQITYYGEEIGMENGEVTCNRGFDQTYNCTLYPSITRDYERTPMHWDRTKFAGFTNGTSPWLPISAKKILCNVEDQLKDPKSHLNVYKNLQKLRSELKQQTEIEINVIATDSDVLEISRFNTVRNEKTNLFKMFLNFGDKLVTVPLSSKGQFVVALSSGNTYRKTGDNIYGTHITLDRYEAVILKCVAPKQFDI